MRGRREKGGKRREEGGRKEEGGGSREEGSEVDTNNWIAFKKFQEIICQNKCARPYIYKPVFRNFFSYLNFYFVFELKFFSKKR